MSAPSQPIRPKEAKLFRNNRSQAVRIPVEFELPGERVLIRRAGNRLIIEPVSQPGNLIELLSEWRQLPAPGAREQLPAIDDAPVSPEDVF